MDRDNDGMLDGRTLRDLLGTPDGLVLGTDEGIILSSNDGEVLVSTLGDLDIESRPPSDSNEGTPINFADPPILIVFSKIL